MGSGRKLSKAETDAILRMVAQRDVDGRWLLSYRQIADRLRLDLKTVSDCVRTTAVTVLYLTRAGPR